MTLPANLFVDTPEMEDVSLHQLGNDVESWPEDIIQKVKERLPHAQSLNMMVKFMKKDDENGVATGSVMLSSTDGKVAVVPVIIKDFMMFPLDVMISSGKILPLNQDYFSGVFNSSQTFAKLEEYPTFSGVGRFEDGSLMNAIYPPGMGRYAYASAGYPICDAVSGTIDGSELKKFLLDPANEKTAARWLTGPHKELVQKLASLQPVNMNEFRQGADNLVPRSVVMARRDGPNRYSILSNADSVFHPQVVQSMPRGDFLREMAAISSSPEDEINDIDMTGEKFLRLPVSSDPVHLATPHTDHVEEATEYGNYSVKSKTGVSVEGVVVPKVIDFEQKVTGLKVFIGKTISALQETIHGVHIPQSRFKPKTCVPKLGQTGVFLYQPDDKHGLCTVPVTVTAVVSDYEPYVKAVTMMGIPLKLRFTPGPELKRIARVGKGEYLLPSSMKWVALEPMEGVTNSAIDYHAKEAGDKLTTAPVTVIPTGFGQFSMKGVDKYASAIGWDKTNLEGYQVKFLLASLGLGSEKIASVLKVAAARGHAELHGLRRPPLASEKIAAAKPLARALVKKAQELRQNLIKEASLLQNLPEVHELPWPGLQKGASYLENSQTVDALLSLNFVSPQNITKYVGKIPALKSAVSHLASCLLASRLGMKEIPEQSTAAAMNRLVETIDGLERLRATQEVAAQ